MSRSMRAMIFRQHSPTLEVYATVDDMPIPVIGPHEVLVRVAFAALNRLDDYVRRGWPGLQLRLPHISGSDFSGVIAQVGEQVSGWQVGQRVTGNPLIWCGACVYCLRGQQNRCVEGRLLGEQIPGTYGDYVKLPARNLVAVPEGYDLRQAAAASLVYVTAWHSLMEMGGLRPGERLLVVGAGGGVNSASIQIAGLAGAEVYVVAGDAAKAGRAAALGAHWVWDRSQDPDWGQALRRAVGREGIDLVVDNVGAATWPTSLRCLRTGGRLLTVGGTSGYGATVPVSYLFARHLRIIGSTMGTQDDYQRVMGLVFQGRLQPVVDRVYRLQDYVQALSHMLEAGHFGKIVLDVGAA